MRPNLSVENIAGALAVLGTSVLMAACGGGDKPASSPVNASETPAATGGDAKPGEAGCSAGHKAGEAGCSAGHKAGEAGCSAGHKAGEAGCGGRGSGCEARGGACGREAGRREEAGRHEEAGCSGGEEERRCGLRRWHLLREEVSTGRELVEASSSIGRTSRVSAASGRMLL